MSETEQEARAAYWREVRLIAESAVREHPDDEEAQDDDARESVDGDQYVIYTGKNLNVLRFTDHTDALWEEYDGFGELPESEGDALAKMAYADMLADVMAQVQAYRKEGLPEEKEE